jgi:hypothetical protein
MSSSLHHEMIRAQQCEIAALAAGAQHPAATASGSRRPRRGVGRRVRCAIGAAALGLGLASTGVALAQAGKPPVEPSGVHVDRATKVSAYERRIHALEAEGYVAEACTVKGILMINPRICRTVIVPL